jgi:hypothetical protein
MLYKHSKGFNSPFIAIICIMKLAYYLCDGFRDNRHVINVICKRNKVLQSSKRQHVLPCLESSAKLLKAAFLISELEKPKWSTMDWIASGTIDILRILSANLSVSLYK